jgi:TonB family protein
MSPRRARRAAAGLLGATLAAAAGPLPAPAGAEDARGEEAHAHGAVSEVAAAARTGPGLEDAVAPSPTLVERLEEIRRRVQEAVVYPERARRRGLSGVTRIRFSIGDDGRAREVETVHSSGHALLDQAAERGARDAAALPYVYGRVEVPVRFALEGR